MVQQLSTNNFGPAKWIVNSTPYLGTHTTIASALTSASSGDTIFIMPGTYTENLTLKAGVNLAAYGCDQDLNHVIISGKCTFTAAGTVSITGIRLQTNSDFALAVTGSAASIVNLNNCYLNMSNNTGISFTTSSSSSLINLNSCQGDLGTTGIAVYASSSAGSLNFKYSNFSNSGGSSTANTISAGSLDVFESSFKNPTTTSSTAAIGSLFSNFDSFAQNATALTLNGSGSQTIVRSSFASGSASAVSIGSSNCSILSSTVNSSNTNAITGAGSLVYSDLGFTNTGFGMNVTTQTARYFRGGISVSAHQPSFLAFAGVQNNVTGDGTVYSITFTTEIFDQNNNFDAVSTFTAPVTGRYFFFTSILFSGLGAGHTTSALALVATSRTINFHNINPQGILTGGGYQLSGNLIVDMTAGDTAIAKITISGSTLTADISGGYFGGYLLC